MTDKEMIREAIMRLSMCANKECEICKYKDRPKKRASIRNLQRAEYKKRFYFGR